MRAPHPLPPGGLLLALRRVAAVAAVVALTLAAASCGSPAPTPAPTASLAMVLPATASPAASAAPATPTASPSPMPSPSPTPFVIASPDPGASPDPSASPSAAPTPSPTPFHGRPMATRVVIASLGVDLAIVKAPRGYPYCNVAMYFGKPFGQPGESRATYVFAHARDGMFGPIYRIVMFQHRPSSMLGMQVAVYTSDDRLHLYRIVRVLPHQLTLNRALAVRKDQLWLQTSEGPHGTPGKTMIIANPVSVSAADHAAAHPKARIVVCG